MEFYNEEKFNEIRARVISNKQTRDDVITLVEMVESIEHLLEEREEYIYEELDVNDSILTDNGEVV